MQFKLAALGFIAAAGGGAFMVAGPGDGEYYDMDPTEAASRLAASRLPGEVSDDMSRDGELEQRVYKRGDGQVVWEFSAVHTPLASFTAHLEPDGPGTRVSVDFELAKSDIADAAISDLGEGREYFSGLLELAMEEHIDATLEKRPYDDAKLERAIAKYAMSNPTATSNAIRRMQEMESSTGSSATEAKMREKREADEAWHGEAEPFDSAGSDPGPAE